MKILNGRYRFKTREQLEASGWVQDEEGTYRHPLIKNANNIPKPMFDLMGQCVDVANGRYYNNSDEWGITEPMVMKEAEIVTQILDKYNEAH